MEIDLNIVEIVQELKKSRVFNVLIEKEQLEAVIHILRLCGVLYMQEDNDFAKEVGELYLKKEDATPLRIDYSEPGCRISDSEDFAKGTQVQI